MFFNPLLRIREEAGDIGASLYPRKEESPVSNLHRIQWIDAQIRAKRYPNSRSIAEQFEISTRQASRDIEYLRYSMNAPLEYSTQYNGYCYSSEAFTLPQLYLDEEEKMALEYLADQYSLLKNTPAARLAGLFSKLTEAQPKIGKASGEIPVYDVSENVIHTYNHLKKAIEAHTAVELMYISSRESGTVRVVSPYKLFTRNGNSYMVGFCELRKGLRVFRLDRISVLRFTSNPYILSPDYNEKDYGEDVGFNYKNAYSCTILSQKYINFGKIKCAVEHTDKYRYTAEFFNSEELIQLLLSQPHPFTIEFPRWLRERLRCRLNQLLEMNTPNEK